MGCLSWVAIVFRFGKIPCTPFDSLGDALLLWGDHLPAGRAIKRLWTTEIHQENPSSCKKILQAVATSNAQNDSGLFELNFRDERYLPFEGAGVMSRWRIELPAEFRQFDYDTISDAVLHIKYTAREGGVTLRSPQATSLTWE